jgi:serine/threonine protein kinase
MSLDLDFAFQIPIKIDMTQSDFSVHPDLLPTLKVDGRLVPATGSPPAPRAWLDVGKVTNEGNYGQIKRATRRQPSSSGEPTAATEVRIKSPLNDSSLVPEALLQWLASETLERAGIVGAVPRVFDIYKDVTGSTRFSMEYIRGCSAAEAMLKTQNPDRIWWQILAQVALLLGYLEEHMFLDHRDLKADNIWIRTGTPVDYTLKVRGHMWRVKAPFQAVILDFGFACIGDAERQARVSLKDSELPLLDPCPKEGRDLFQFLATSWGIPELRGRVSSAFAEDIEELLSHRGTAFGAIARAAGAAAPYWVNFLVDEAGFRYPPLHPVNLLEKLSLKGACVQRLSGHDGEP